MAIEEWNRLWQALDWDEKRIKMQLLLYVTHPDAFKNRKKEWLNNQINLNLDKLREVNQQRQWLLEMKPKDIQ